MSVSPVVPSLTVRGFVAVPPTFFVPSQSPQSPVVTSPSPKGSASGGVVFSMAVAPTDSRPSAMPSEMADRHLRFRTVRAPTRRAMSPVYPPLGTGDRARDVRPDHEPSGGHRAHLARVVDDLDVPPIVGTRGEGGGIRRL